MIKNIVKECTDKSISSTDFTSYTRVEVKPISNEETFITAIKELGLGEMKQTKERNYQIMLDESVLAELVVSKTH